MIVHKANAYGADWSAKRNIGKRESGGCGVNGENVRIIFRVGGEHQGNNLGLIAEAFGKEWADRTVNLAGGQDFTFAGTAFTLNKAAGDSSTGVGIFAIINGEREKIDSLAWVGRAACGAKHHVIAEPDNNRALCLFGQMSGFKMESFAACKFNSGCLFHVIPRFLEGPSALWVE